MKTQVKCSTSGCYRRKRVTIEEVQFLRQESERAGQRAGRTNPAPPRTWVGGARDPPPVTAAGPP